MNETLWAYTGTHDDTGDVPSQQGKSQGNDFVFDVLQPYGLFGSPPPKSAALIFDKINGQQSNKAGIPTRPVERIKNTEPWEVGIGNYKTKDHVIFKSTGSIEVNSASGSKVIIDAAGNITAIADGSVTVTSSANDVAVNGDTKITGDLIVTGTITCTQLSTVGGATISGSTMTCNHLTATTSATIAGKDFSTHQHSGVTTGGSNTGGVV